MSYPAGFPEPLRAQYSTELNFLTQETQMESGYIVQRRMEPYIFRQITLAYTMRMDEWFSWFAWANEFGFDWFIATIQGSTVRMRYISNIEYNYDDYGTVTASVTAEQRLLPTVEAWTGDAPALYEPPINDADGAVDGGVTPDIDLNTAFDPVTVTLDTSPKNLIIRTPVRQEAFGALFLYVSDPTITAALYDSVGSTLLGTFLDGSIRWHQDTGVSNDMLRLVAGEDYQLRLTGPVDSTVEVWGAAQ